MDQIAILPSIRARSYLGLPAEAAAYEAARVIEGKSDPVDPVHVSFHDIDSETLLLNHKLFLLRF